MNIFNYVPQSEVERKTNAQSHISQFQNLSLISINQVSEFWKNNTTSHEQDIQRDSLFLAGRSILSALYHSRTSFQYRYFVSHDRNLSIQFGFSKNSLDLTQLISLLEAHYAGLRCKSVKSAEKCNHELRDFFFSVGTPSASLDGKSLRSDFSADPVIATLLNEECFFDVYAIPVHPNFVLEKIQKTFELRKDYILNRKADEKRIHSDRQIDQYIQHLDVLISRLQEAYNTGYWKVLVRVQSHTRSHLDMVKSAFHSVFWHANPCIDPFDTSEEPSSTFLTTSELSFYTYLPKKDYCGYIVTPVCEFGAPLTPSPTSYPIIELGKAYQHFSLGKNGLSIPVKDLCRHIMITGITGSGKTNTIFNLLVNLWNNHQVPFLVIESAKSEYRNLKSIIPCKVYTVKDETIAPLRINPFEFEVGILAQTHIDYIKSLFSACFVLYPPMPYMLEQSIQEIYEDKGWDVLKNTNQRGEVNNRAFPKLTDLINKVQQVIERSAYDERISKDVRAALLSRLNQLLIGGMGEMFNTSQSISFEELMKTPSIIELKSIVSDDEKAFVMGLLMIRLAEYHETKSKKITEEGNVFHLKHLTVIEEAHRLLRNVSMESTSIDSANPKGKAIEVFSNILSEIRSFGEGFCISEQIPVKLMPDVIKNTSTKVVHRILSKDDRDVLTGAMNLSEDQAKFLSTMDPGMAVVAEENQKKPILVQIPSVIDKLSHVTEQELKTMDDNSLPQNHRWLLELKSAKTIKLLKMARTYILAFLVISSAKAESKTLFEKLIEHIRIHFNSPLEKATLYSMIDNEISFMGNKCSWPFPLEEALCISINHFFHMQYSTNAFMTSGLFTAKHLNTDSSFSMIKQILSSTITPDYLFVAKQLLKKCKIEDTASSIALFDKIRFSIEQSFVTLGDTSFLEVVYQCFFSAIFEQLENDKTLAIDLTKETWINELLRYILERENYNA